MKLSTTAPIKPTIFRLKFVYYRDNKWAYWKMSIFDFISDYFGKFLEMN